MIITKNTASSRQTNRKSQSRNQALRRRVPSERKGALNTARDRGSVETHRVEKQRDVGTKKEGSKGCKRISVPGLREWSYFVPK